MNKKRLTIAILLTFQIALFPQSFQVNKIEPPNWWTGLKKDTVQLMVYGQNMKDVSASVEDKHLKIADVVPVENSDYAFINLILGHDYNRPGSFNILFSKDGDTVSYTYEIKEREFAAEAHTGFTNEDVIYLVFPDRFSNGTPGNDFVSNSRDEFEYRSLNGRHGGDIQGIIDRLDYLYDLGVSAIWITPLLENDMYMSYHGYAATDLYKVDERFGSNKLYKEMVYEAHKRGMKVIYDHVSNHVGINCEWIKDLPQAGWINGTVEDHNPADHNKTSVVDVHADEYSKRLNETGWFTDYMVDLNQRNELLANYLIQNMIWWIEYTGLDGIREDTYPYANQEFQSRFAKEILDEYPNMNIVGEVWEGEPAFLAGFQKDSPLRKDFNTYLPSVFDFGFRDAMADYLSGGSIREVYKIFAMDYLYPNPDYLVPFLDNHDMDRAMFLAGNNKERFKIALTLLLTTRGIPQIFYGTEIGISTGGHHGRIRQEFPGGFVGDKRDAFTHEGRTELENELFDYMRKLISLRKKYTALATGEFQHYMPGGEVYVYTKTIPGQKILAVINNNDESISITSNEMKPLLNDYSSMLDLLDGEEIVISEMVLTIPAACSGIYLLQ